MVRVAAQVWKGHGTLEDPRNGWHVGEQWMAMVRILMGADPRDICMSCYEFCFSLS